MSERRVLADLSIDNVPPGARTPLWLDVAGALAGSVAVPALLVKGRQPGRTLLAVAGIHGDEYEGMEAIRRVYGRLDVETMRGTFLGIVVANPFAYEARTRVAPLHIDGLNLARIFPGDPAGSLSHVLADQLLGLVLRNLTPDDLFIDFHSGSADVPFAPLIGFREGTGGGRARAEEAARHFGLERLWAIPDSPGPFNAETARGGITTLGTETTGRAGCDPLDVDLFERGLASLLGYLGICPEWPMTARYGGSPRSTLDIIAPATGFLRSTRRLHDDVVAGDRLATIVDLFGAPVAEIASPIDGTLWAARAMPAVRAGELCFMVASAETA
jgi:predicted deacylase